MSLFRYIRQFSFSGFQATNPAKPLPGASVDNELENIERSLNDLVSGLTDIRRDDGALKNGIVTKDALAPGLTTGVDPATTWQTGVNYSANNVVFFEAAFYRCLESHTSTVFANDLAANRWIEFADFGQYFTDVEGWRGEAVAARGDAQGAAAAAATSAGTASTAATTATTAAGTATTAAGTATTAANSAAASYDLFDDRYLGEKTSLPTLDNDGNALVNGALVSLTGQVDPNDNGMYVRRNNAWAQMFSPANALRNRIRYSSGDGNLTNGQTTFTVVGGYTVGFLNVFVNGVRQADGLDFTATDGTTFVLGTAVISTDVVEAEAFGTFNAAAVPSTAISDSTTVGRAVLTAASAPAARAAIGADPALPRLLSYTALKNPAAFATWEVSAGVRHGFFGQYYDPANGGYDQTGTVRVVNDDGTVGAVVQTFTTQGLYSVEPFTIGSDRFVFLGYYAKTSGGFTYSVNSLLLRWNAGTSQYVTHQTFGLDGVVRGQYSFVDGIHFLSIGSSVVGANNYSRFLYIYSWNDSIFTLVQAPSTQGCYAGVVAKARNVDRLAFTCEYTDGTSGGQIRNNQVLKWNGSTFAAWQTWQGKGTSDVVVFDLHGETYAAFANQFDSQSNEVGSPIFRVLSTGLQRVCDVRTAFGIRIRKFDIGGRVVLAYCNAARGNTTRTDYDESSVDLYVFDGSAAKRWMSIPSKGAYDVYHWLNSYGQSLIGIANSVGGTEGAENTNQGVAIYRIPSEPSVGEAADGHMVPPVFGQCRLVRVSNTQVRLDRFNGRYLTIEGRPDEIPHGGILRDNAALAANQTYRVYAHNLNGPIEMIISSRPAFFERSAGLYVKDDDFRYTLVGQVTTDNNAQFPSAANVISWFNSTLPFTV